MPVQPTYPGVYIEEAVSSVKTIVGVSTSITAFIGRAARGPVDEPVQIFGFGEYERIFGGLWSKSTMSFAVRDFFLNGGGSAIIVRVHKTGEASEVTINASDFADAGTKPLILKAKNVGSWGDLLTVEVNYDTRDASKPVADQDKKLFNLKLSDGNITEQYFNATTDVTQPDNLQKVLAESSALATVSQMPTARPIITKHVKDSKDVLTISKNDLITGITFKAGKDGVHIGDTEIFSGASMQANKTGLYALEKADLFNLLCITPFATSTGTAPADDAKATDITGTVIAAAAEYCRVRRAMLIIDPPSTWKTMDSARTNLGTFPNTNSNYAALYFPRLMQANPLSKNQIEEFVPCGAVAGVMARTDAQRGVWKAPAGQDASMAGVVQFSVPLTDQENGVLNQLGVNCLRTFPVYGRLVWGARTREGADVLGSQWKYIPVRRTALFIEESLYRGSKWIVFEPNDESLWAQIRLNVGAFMHNLFRQGAFQGKTPKDAYLVKCDSETTTQNDINQGIVNILVGFAPLKPAEFVMIKIQQLTGQIDA